jgi:subtilase family serine protease
MIEFRATAAGIATAGLLLAPCSSGPALAASGTGDYDSATTCYTPGQLAMAYGIQPLTSRGIDGRGETVVIPALAESQPNPPAVSDLRQDIQLIRNGYS